MSIIDQILGEATSVPDVSPVMAARVRPSAARKNPPTDKEDKKLRDKARQSSVIASIIGMAESDNESIIPANAKPVDPLATLQIPGMSSKPTITNDSPSEPAISGTHGEELIPPTCALVAPDVTPKVFQLIDPSQVPAPPKPSSAPPTSPTVTSAPPADTGALDTLLGRNNAPPVSAPIPVTAESFLHTINPIEVKSRVAGKLVPASAGGAAMPEHKEGDGRTIFDVTRSLLG